MSKGITGNRHHGGNMMRKSTYLSEWKMKKARRILPGYPKTHKFTKKKEVDDYLSGEKVVCLLCGKSYKALVSHLSVHNITVEEYRERYGISQTKGLVGYLTSETISRNSKRAFDEGKYQLDYCKTKAANSPRRYSKPQSSSPQKYTDDDYWEVLRLGMEAAKHPREVSRENKGKLPSIAQVARYKLKFKNYEEKYYEVMESLSFAKQISHQYISQKYVDELNSLKEKGYSLREIARILNVPRGSVVHQLSAKTAKGVRSERLCPNGHPYKPGNSRCGTCAQLKRKDATPHRKSNLNFQAKYLSGERGK